MDLVADGEARLASGRLERRLGTSGVTVAAKLPRRILAGTERGRPGPIPTDPLPSRWCELVLSHALRRIPPNELFLHNFRAYRTLGTSRKGAMKTMFTVYPAGGL
jgi:hypothetical protein